MGIPRIINVLHKDDCFVNDILAGSTLTKAKNGVPSFEADLHELLAGLPCSVCNESQLWYAKTSAEGKRYTRLV